MDLNLLVALDVLLREGSVTRAAEQLHLSTPAMSRTLSRLRDETGDPLFVRAGRKLVPTPRALAMRERVRVLVEEARQLLEPVQPIEPREFRRVVTIRVNDGVIAALGGLLGERVAAEASGLTLRFVAEGDESVEALRDGDVDLDIGVQGALGPEIRVQALLRDRIVGLAGASFDAREPLSLARFAACSHVGVSRRGKLRGPVDALLDAAGHVRTVRAVVPNLLAAAAFVASSDALALASESFVASIATLMPVQRVPLAFRLPDAELAQAWHPRWDKDPVHVWVRGAVRACARTLAKRAELHRAQ